MENEEEKRKAALLLESLVDRQVSTLEDRERLLFRVTGTRLDKTVTNLTSMQLGQTIGFSIGTAFPEWGVSMRFCNLDFVAVHETRCMVVGARLHAINLPKGGETIAHQFAAELQRRAVGQALARGEFQLTGVRYACAAPSHFKHDIRGSKGGNAMNPAIANLLVSMADLQPGEVLVDPMAGTGTIPLEAALAYPGVLALGGDLDSSEVVQQRENGKRSQFEASSAMFGRRVPADSEVLIGLRWNATRLPLRSASIDAIVCDMPFGKRCGSSKTNSALYPRLMSEFARILRPGGRAILLTLETGAMKEIDTAVWRLAEVPFVIDMNGLRPHVFSLVRSDTTADVVASPGLN